LEADLPLGAGTVPLLEEELPLGAGTVLLEETVSFVKVLLVVMVVLLVVMVTFEIVTFVALQGNMNTGIVKVILEYL